jgi:hypothetical protein
MKRNQIDKVISFMLKVLTSTPLFLLVQSLGKDTDADHEDDEYCNGDPLNFHGISLFSIMSAMVTREKNCLGSHERRLERPVFPLNSCKIYAQLLPGTKNVRRSEGFKIIRIKVI